MASWYFFHISWNAEHFSMFVEDKYPVWIACTDSLLYLSLSLPTSDIGKFASHDDVIKWKHFPRYWPFVRGIHRSPVNSPHKDQWRRALMFSLICTRINGWVNNGEAGDFRRYRAHYDVTVMEYILTTSASPLDRDEVKWIWCSTIWRIIYIPSNFHHYSSESVNSVLPSTPWNVGCDLLKFVCGKCQREKLIDVSQLHKIVIVM